MATVTELDTKLNQMILQGQALDAFDAFYADDVVMQENADAPREGKATNRAYEEQFFGSIEQFHGASLGRAAVTGDSSFSEWMWDVTFKGGPRVQMHQCAVRTWKDGKVATERFYYAKG